MEAAARRSARSSGRVVAAALLIAATGCSGARPPTATREKATGRYISYLESPDRARWQKPEEVVRALEIRPGSHVTDLGAGSGYFARRFVNAVGPRGTVEALDVDPALLDYLRRTADEQGIHVEARRVLAADPQLTAHGSDLVFLCNTYHDLRNRVAYLEKLAGGLDAEGRVAVVDFHKRADVPEGPPLDEKIDRQTVVTEFHEAGYLLDREESFLPYQYFLVFRPVRAYSFGPLVEAAGVVMASPAPDRDKQRQIATLLSTYVRDRRLEERFQRADPARPVTTYLLYTDPHGRFSLAALVFQPHARTAVHDHQSWVVWSTYRGRERETRYRRRDVSGAAFPKLTKAWSRVFGAGELSFIDPPPGDVHDVANATDAVSVSLHLHATDIGKQERNTYDVEHQIVRSFVQSYEQAL